MSFVLLGHHRTGSSYMLDVIRHILHAPFDIWCSPFTIVNFRIAMRLQSVIFFLFPLSYSCPPIPHFLQKSGKFFLSLKQRVNPRF